MCDLSSSISTSCHASQQTRVRTSKSDDSEIEKQVLACDGAAMLMNEICRKLLSIALHLRGFKSVWLMLFLHSVVAKEGKSLSWK